MVRAVASRETLFENDENGRNEIKAEKTLRTYICIVVISYSTIVSGGAFIIL